MKPTDLELMEFADGESDVQSSARLEAALTQDPMARDRVAGVKRMGATVRAYLEHEADAADPQLAEVWEKVAARIKTTDAKPTANLTSPMGWFERYRRELFAGLLGAGVAAGVALAVRAGKSEAPLGVAVAPTSSAGVSIDAPIPAAPNAKMQFAAAPPEVEAIDVTAGNSMMFTIKDEEGQAAVVWITPEDSEEL